MISDVEKETLRGAELSAEIELFELDISRINTHKGENIWLFCNELNELNEPVVWRDRTFLPIPIEFEGVSKKSEGTSNRPRLTVGNIDGYMTGVIVKYNGLIGAKLTRYRVRAHHLDAVNFKAGNDQANSDEYVADSYIFNSASGYNKYQATFELSLPTETDGASLPNRTILASVCPFKYRGIGCGYDGHAIADIEGYALAPHEMEKDRCGKSLRDCQARYGINGQLPFGGFVMADKVAK